MNRRKAREYTFILLFQYKFQPNEMQDILADFFAQYDAGEQAEYIRDVVEGTVKNIQEIDAKIGEFSKGWSIERISAVSIAVMRLCVYEMKYCKSIPENVSVNEAVNLVREYEGEEAVPFVNGILDSIKKTLCV